MPGRRALLLGAPAAALMATYSRAEPAPKVIGVLSPYGRADAQATLQVFRRAMRDLGYREGKDVVLVERFAEGRQRALAVPGR